MDTLFRKSDRLLANVSMEIVREKMSEIHWNAQLISIMGAKGVGKSTLIKQYLKQNYQPLDRRMLYCSADTVEFSTRTLVELAEEFVIRGGELLVIDEIHKYKSGTSDWSREIKLIYDTYPELKVTISGSSLLQILNSEADLSRRCIWYNMQGLSFREFLQFYKGIDLPVASFDEILFHTDEVCHEINTRCRPVPLFHEYLQVGYFPYYLEGEKRYYERVGNVIDYVIGTELPMVCKVETVNVRKLQMLLNVVAGLVPYEVDISKIALMLQSSRNTVITYLRYLSMSKVINLLYSDTQSLKKVQKPDKMYLENPNMLYALCLEKANIGTARETFVVNQLGYQHRIEYGKKNGDFKLDGKYVFEVGGATKNFDQVADIPDSYILADDIELPVGNKLPLWLAGLLY